MKKSSSILTFLEHTTPLKRVLISMLPAIICSFFFSKSFPYIISILAFWSVFAICYLIFLWVTISTMQSEDIKRKVEKEDGGRVFVFIMIILTSIGCLFGVLMLLINKYDISQVSKELRVTIAITGIISSWALVHTIYTFHYAHFFYTHYGSMDFFGNLHPTYIDFAYFSFGIGCTFQVSDIAVKNSQLRKKVFIHSLLSFFINSFTVALTVNLIPALAN